jgi:zinc protease
MKTAVLTVLSAQCSVLSRTRPILAAGLAFLSLLAPSIAPAIEIPGMPAPGEPHRLVVATPSDKTLANGLRVIVLEREGEPLISAELLVKGGVETDPPLLSGLTSFTASLLKRGTKNRTAPKVAEDIEALGAKIDEEATWDRTSLVLTTLSSNAEPSLSLLTELVREPAFAKEEIERARMETLDDIRLALEEPGQVAKLAAIRATLPADAHPPAGTIASVSRFTRKDIVAQHARLFRPDRCILTIAGKISAADAFALAEKLFGSWQAGAPDNTPAPKPAPETKPRTVLIDMPNAGQAAVLVATPSITRQADDWFAGKVATAVLGGGYSSRLNQEIRVKRGLSYGASSMLSTRRARGIFLSSAQTKNESAVEVVKLMQTEFARMASEPVPLDYLKTRKALLTGALARDLETNAHTVQRIGELALYDLPLDSLSHYFDDVEKVQPEELQTFAKAHLVADSFTVVIAGQAKIVEKPLRAAFPKLEVIPLSKLDLDSPTLKAAGRK